MSKPKVYFTKTITPESLVKLYEVLEAPLFGKVAVKISTGELGNPNYLKPELIQDLIAKVQGTIVECNVAYAGGRDQTATHLQTAKDHGFTAIASVDIMDADGEMTLPISNGRHLQVNYVGKNLDNYDSMINLAHFKGHEMAGFGGALKNQAIGIASASGKAYIHTAGKLRDCAEFMACFDDPAKAAESLPAQDAFLESMAEAAKSVADHFHLKTGHDHAIIYINVLNNLSRDCDCAAEPEAVHMSDIGMVASLDPVALDQACVDLIYHADDPGRDAFVQRIEEQHATHILEYAEELGLGSRDYELINLS